MAPRVDAGTGVRAGIPILLWPATQICMMNSPVPGEYLENQAILLILRPLFLSNFFVHDRGICLEIVCVVVMFDGRLNCEGELMGGGFVCYIGFYACSFSISFSRFVRV